MKKEEQISEIKRIVVEHFEGSVTTGELELGSSPCIMSTGNKTNISFLVETFGEDNVTVVHYVNETEISEDDVDYEDLSDDIVDEIYNLLEEYEIGLDKTMNKIRGENF